MIYLLIFVICIALSPIVFDLAIGYLIKQDEKKDKKMCEKSAKQAREIFDRLHHDL